MFCKSYRINKQAISNIKKFVNKLKLLKKRQEMSHIKYLPFLEYGLKQKIIIGNGDFINKYPIQNVNLYIINEIINSARRILLNVKPREDDSLFLCDKTSEPDQPGG